MNWSHLEGRDDLKPHLLLTTTKRRPSERRALVAFPVLAAVGSSRSRTRS